MLPVTKVRCVMFIGCIDGTAWLSSSEVLNYRTAAFHRLAGCSAVTVLFNFDAGSFVVVVALL